LVGHNTDGEGFSDALHAAGFDPGGKHVVLLGAGGAARAVACGAQGARVEVIARRPQEVSWANMRAWTTDNLLECFAGADLVVDCTPTGLDSVTDAEFTNALPLDNLKSGAWVATLVYHRRTRLLERASSLGHATLDGRAMLVHQGARAFTIWTGSAAPIEVMARALDASLAR
jgi:shikimate dehydrogenase